MVQKIKYLNCNSEKIIKRGFRLTANGGRLQRYQCKACRRRFILDDGFYRMRNTPEKRTQSLHLYFSGTRFRKTQEHLGVFHSPTATMISSTFDGDTTAIDHIEACMG